MLKKILKWVLVMAGLGFLLYVGFLLMVMSAFGAFDKTYTKEEVIENYETKRGEFAELQAYYTSIVPKGKEVTVEFDGNDVFGIFHIATYDSATGKWVSDNNWDLPIKSRKADSLMAGLGWQQEKLKALKLKLDKANCISVSNSVPFNIGFQRSGLGKYYYNLFNETIPDSLKEHYNDGCTYVIYTDKVVFEYGGGAVGPQCFPW